MRAIGWNKNMDFKIDFNFTLEDFEECEEAEKGYFNPDTTASSFQAYNWYLKNPDIEIGVRDVATNKIAGQATILPLNKEQYDKFISGELKDTEFSEKNLLQYEGSKEYYLLLCCIVIKKEYRDNPMVLYFGTIYSVVIIKLIITLFFFII